jgi:predicted Zn-dependent protease
MNKMNPADAKTVRDLVDIPPEVLALAHKNAIELYGKGQLDEAEVLLKGIIAVDEKDAWAHALYGAVRAKQARYGDAITLLQTALSLDPDNAKIRQMRDELAAFLRHMAEKGQHPTR